MKYKNIFLIFILLILSGCSAEYNIKINNNFISENLEINNVDINNFKNFNLPIDNEIDDVDFYSPKEEGIDYYNIETTDNTANIYYDFNNEDFDFSMLFKSCYEDTTFSKDDYELLITTSNEFLCFNEYEELENLTIKINSNYKLINTNADKIDKHNYYWYINKNNKDNKKIVLRLNTRKLSLSIIEKLMESSYFVPLFLIGITLIIIFIIYMLKKIGEGRNKI